MPLFLLGIPLAMATGAFAVKLVSDEVQETAQETLPAASNNIVILAAAGLGLYAAFRILEAKRK